MSVDYERYARERPIFWGDFEYPKIFLDAIANCRGAYADVGAGDGGQIRSALDQGLLAGFSRIIAVDISAERVARLLTLLPEVEGVVADAESLPFPDGSIDFVFSSQVIEHVPNDGAMAKEIARVLVPGGVAVVGSALRLPGAWYFYRYRGRWVLDPTHVREYESIDQYSAVFTDAALQVASIEIEPIRYALSDLFMRALLATRLLRGDAAGSMYRRHPILARLRRVRVAVPRYRHVFAHLTKQS
jgi:ubiquinone/menaquinone biosynthesis C-methylase UbiE